MTDKIQTTVEQLFVRLAEIDSISGEEKQIRQFVFDYLDHLGMRPQIDQFGNLFVGQKRARFFLTAHLDTVEPGRGVQVINDRGVFRSRTQTIVGGDNKAGLAVILAFLQQLSSVKRKKVELIFTVEEELGLLGARHFDTRLLSADFGISFDNSDYDFGQVLTVGADYAEKFVYQFIGQAHHASRPVPEENPLVAIIQLFSRRLPGFLEDGQTTFHLGEISGFKQLNSTAESLWVKGDVRGRSKDKVLVLYKRLDKILSEIDTQVKVKLTREIVSAGYLLSQQTVGYQQIVQSLKRLGYHPEIVERGKVTDATVFSSQGKPCYLLPVGVYNTHSVSEYVRLSEMVRALNYLFFLINRL